MLDMRKDRQPNLQSIGRDYPLSDTSSWLVRSALGESLGDECLSCALLIRA